MMIPAFNTPHTKFNVTQPKASRRSFLLGTLALSGSLVVGFRSPALAQEQAAASAAVVNPLAAYIKIDADNKVTIYSSQYEMGQGVYHGIATLVNEELGADWANITVEGAVGDVALYGNVAWGGAIQGTGGSTSMTSSWERYRKAGAVARMMLITAAAKQWNVPAAEIKAEMGTLTHASGKSASFGEMAGAAAALDIPADVPLKAKAQWTQIGSDTLKRYDSKVKTNGTQLYPIDVDLPGIKTAVMMHPPMFGATVKSFDASKAKAVKGFVEAVQTPRGVAIVADNMWSAIKARETVMVEWDDSAAEKRGTAELFAEFRDQSAKPGIATARDVGKIDEGFKNATTVMEATVELPYLAHAALEPYNAVAQKNGDMIEIWGGHQNPGLHQFIASQVAGTTPDKVKMHVMKSGGGFGRRGTPDADVITEAVAIGVATGWKYPVKVQWTRDNDMKGGRYRPAYVHRFKAGLDKDGKLIAWSNHIVGQSIVTGTVFEQGFVKDGVDVTSVEGASNIPYDIPNIKVELSTMKTGIPVLWWRAVGSSHTAYAVETFIDELAEAAKKDPIEFRLVMLDKAPRHQAVLKLLAEKSGWSTPLGEGKFRGVALAEAFSTVVAQVVEISMPSSGEVKIERVVVAVDCGTVINPDQVRAQVEGAVGFGLGAVLQEELTLTKGVVDQANYDSYTPLRINQMPKVEVHWIESDAAPTGIGEPPLPPVGPALANAIYQATKKRQRILPLLKNMV